MHYHLSFLDHYGRVQSACEADIATEGVAISWMQIVGWAWARHDDWSVMELTCQGRLVARVPALMLDTPLLHAYEEAAAAIPQNWELLGVPESRRWAGAEHDKRGRRASHGAEN